MNFRLISKKNPDVINILSFVIFFILSCDSSESIQPSEQNKVDPFFQNKKVAKTINLGNALDAPNEGEWGVTLEAEYFQIIKPHQDLEPLKYLLLFHQFFLYKNKSFHLIFFLSN